MAEPEKNGQEEMKEGDEEEEEYVMLDLDGVAEHIRIPENAPYVLTGLDTLNPILVIDNKIKLIGEYTETIGTCLVFKETGEHLLHLNFNGEMIQPLYILQIDNAGEEEEVGPSEANKTPAKKINPMAQLTKVLRFKPCLESDSQEALD